MREQSTRRRRTLVDDKDDYDERDRAYDEAHTTRRRESDDEDERPAGRRREGDDEERGSGRRRRDEDDRDERPRRPARRVDDEERPRSRRRDEDDEDERPARSRRRDEEERPRSRRRRDDEDEERGSGRRADRDRGEANSGWDAAKAVVAESSGFATPQKFTSKPIVVKLLDDAPFDSYRTHWLEDAKGRKKYRCLKSDCPLCDPFGDETNGSAIHFNIVSFEDPDTPRFAYIEAGARLARALDNLGQDERYDGLSDPKLYVAISVTGPKKNPEYQVKDVKERDLYDDWDIDPLTDEDYERFERKRYTGPVEPLPTRRELQDLIKELTSPRR